MSAVKRRQEVLGEYSPESISLGKRIFSGDINATQYLKQEIASGKATMEMARMCLCAEFQRIRTFPRRERIEILQREQSSIARIVLDMLWQDQALWMPVLVHDTSARLALLFRSCRESTGPPQTMAQR